ncbi:MAG: hypothetical protein M1839_003128 [Geoglossum umbratile]|nr:MAG: hypothetical protein M1839_003128 [Geoglossum umbratile]
MTSPSSRNSSVHSQIRSPHTPLIPSNLRNSREPPPSPEETFARGVIHMPQDDDGFQPTYHDALLGAQEETASAEIIGPEEVSAFTHLLTRRSSHAHPGPCDHGTFSPRPPTRDSFGSYSSSRLKFRDTFGDPEWDGHPGEPGDSSGLAGLVEARLTGGRKKMSTTQWLARRHGLSHTKSMYINYYIPFFSWVRQYRRSWLLGDVVAGLSMASFYIPMALSYASNLGHVPPINGLYAFVFQPIIYALLGSCPAMVVGPEAAGSLLVGNVVRSSVERGHSDEDNGPLNAQIAGAVTVMAGGIIFAGGIARLGFLDNVLSRPLLRGFISAVGFLIFVDQLIVETGLSDRARDVEVSHGTTFEKMEFLFHNLRYSHGLTAAVSGISFTAILVGRELKKRLQPRFPGMAYIPDRFLVVVLSAVLTRHFRWDKRGLDILGEVKSSTTHSFPFHWPFQISHMKHIREALSTSFLIAILGFFESSVAAKSIGGGEGRGDGLQGMPFSPNRELLSLGIANLVGGCFMALPAFGGYGRSKVNVATGGRTPMSSIVLSIITINCVLFLLPCFYYLPKAVLSAMISVVAWSLIEEAPSDIRFFLRIRGWSELILMALIFFSTIFYSLPLGIAAGVGLSIIYVIRHSTRPRIQILGRVPGTNDFENAELVPEALEFIEGCLIVKIPEPLTFANTGDLKNRLRRLELYGTMSVHPALPRMRSPEHNLNIIFDVHAVTSLDGSGAQVLAEIVNAYRARGVRVFFCRVPPEKSKVYRLFVSSGIMESCGGSQYFVKSVTEALRLSELEVLHDDREGAHGGATA